MGSLELNYADISPPYMTLNEERASRLPYVSPMYQISSAFVYRRVEASKPNLGMFTSSQWHVWAFASTMALLAVLISAMKRHLCGPKDMWYWDKYLTRQNVILAFFFGIFLR